MTRGKEKRRYKTHKVRDEAMEGEVEKVREKVLGGQIVTRGRWWVGRGDEKGCERKIRREIR